MVKWRVVGCCMYDSESGLKWGVGRHLRWPRVVYKVLRMYLFFAWSRGDGSGFSRTTSSRAPKSPKALRL